MAERLAFLYVRLFLALEMVLLGLALVLHVSVLIGETGLVFHFVPLLAPLSFVMGASAFAFLKGGLQWRDQFKSCPKWMWIGILGVVGYCLLLFFGQRLLLSGGVPVISPFAPASALLFLFDANALCILYSVLYSHYLEGPEVARRVLHSMSAIAISVAAIWAYYAGYLPLNRHQTETLR